jgi:hypothetical protein
MTFNCDAHFLNIIGGGGGGCVVVGFNFYPFFAGSVEIKRRTIYIGKKIKFTFSKCLKCFRLLRVYIHFKKVLDYFFVLLNGV